VFVALADPVTSGFVTNLARPGRNMTGVASQFEELGTKQLQLLKETAPKISRVALLHHAEIPSAIVSEADTARKLGLTARAVKVGGRGDFERAFVTIRRERAEAIHVLPLRSSTCTART
jgi:putative ABC transport system substrate-binding protein